MPRLQGGRVDRDATEKAREVSPWRCGDEMTCRRRTISCACIRGACSECAGFTRRDDDSTMRCAHHCHPAPLPLWRAAWRAIRNFFR